MKTAMVEFIDELTRMYNMDYGGAKDGLKIAIDTAMNHLKSIEKEKEQIIDAWCAGYDGCDNDFMAGRDAPDEKYYNETYNK